MIALLYWREIIICILFASCLWLINLNQDARYEAKEVRLIHEKLIAESDAKNSNIIATAQRQRQLDAENYAKEINIINDRYADLAKRGDRVQLEIKNHSERLNTISREAVENYAKVGATLYSECRKEYLDLGYYAAKLDSELDSKTKPN